VLPLRGTPNEYNCYGTITSEKSRTSTQEATQLIQRALSDPEPFAWAGEHYQFPVVAVWPRTVQQPFPPMYYSGNNLESAKYAGAHRLGMCTSFLPPPVVAETVAAYLTEAARMGWQPTLDQVVHRNHIVVAETAAEAAAMEANFMPAHRRKVMANNMKANRGATEAVVMAEWAARFEGGKLLFAGTPDMIVEQIEAFHAQTGVGLLDLIFGSGLLAPAAVRRSIELFGQEVLPRIRHIGQTSSAPQPVAVGQGAEA
jgi:alkanesulfonate monooxygenase SsuD/methylene tetrahydromethanopterin reductase-like flavin-dependent oxidoreductase (luciferase family)